MTFKVGDKIRRVSNAAPWAPIGYETVVTGVPENPTYTDINGDKDIDARVCDWELIQDGPVRTVTRQEIIPGMYDGVEVGSEVTGHPQREVMVRIAIDHGPMVCMDHEGLTRAAAVLTALAGALRDGK